MKKQSELWVATKPVLIFMHVFLHHCYYADNTVKGTIIYVPSN